MGFVDIWSSKMQGQWIFSKSGGRATIFGWVHKIWVFWTGGWLPLPKSTSSQKSSVVWALEFGSGGNNYLLKHTHPPNSVTCLIGNDKNKKIEGHVVRWTPITT